MKELLQTSSTRGFAILMAITIALGITVNKVFLVAAQTIAVVACVYLMIALFHRRRWATQAHRHP